MKSKPLALVSELKESTPHLVHLDSGEDIILIKCDGEVFALDSLCPHMGGPLNEGTVENKCLTCPWHGWEFKIDTGESITPPGEDIKKFPLRIEEGRIYLDKE